MASRLVYSLSQCGQKMEAEQLLRDTLSRYRRVLGPTHELALRLIVCVLCAYIRASMGIAFSCISESLAIFLIVGLAYLAAR